MSMGYQPDGQSFSPEVWHLQFRTYWLGRDDYRLPTGEVASIPRSTADLDTEEFGAYMDSVEVWANSRGIFLDE